MPRRGLRPVRCPEAGRRDVPLDQVHQVHPVHRDHAAVLRSELHRRGEPRSEVSRPVLLSAAPFAESSQVPASRRKAEAAVGAEVSSVASAQRAPSSLPEAAAVGVAAYGPAEQPSAAPAGPDAREQGEAAAGVVSDARAQPREAAVAEPDAEPAEGAVAEAEPDVALLPGVAAEVVRGAVLRRVAVPVAPERRPVVGPSVAAAAWVFRRDQLPPRLAPRRAAQFAHAMRKSRAVPRSEQWWPAAGCEDFS